MFGRNFVINLALYLQAILVKYAKGSFKTNLLQIFSDLKKMTISNIIRITSSKCQN